MREARKRGQRMADDLVGRFPGDRRDKPYAAGVVIEARVDQGRSLHGQSGRYPCRRSVIRRIGEGWWGIDNSRLRRVEENV
jgi:hypothetical protein